MTAHDPLCGSTQKDRIPVWDCRDCTLIVQAQGRATAALVRSLTRDGIDDFTIGRAVGAVLTGGRR